STITRHPHLFPVGAHVQRNVETEDALLQAIRIFVSGYIALVGPPGTGKSTLLQTCLATEINLRVIRYLAYVPGTGQGIGRGEADDFLDDVASQLKKTGLQGVRFRNNTSSERREHFSVLLQQAGNRYQQDQIRTLIVVDGLDHVPREENPQHSFLAELPLPASIPDGVLFVLGTQRLDLQDLKPSVRDQADATGRKVVVSPLKRKAVHRMADLLNLDTSVDRDQIFELSHGHPLVARYLIEALREADGNRRLEILGGSIRFEGDLETIYESAWRDIKDDDRARSVLDYIARAEGPIPLTLLIQAVPEPDIERALKAARHLLVKSSQGWSVFHNSFRLYIIRKPYLRLDEVDAGYSARIYRQLANLARSAPNDTPQRWLELRYLARAQDHAAVLQLAQPTRFREQFAQMRPFSELLGDIRLAFASAAKSQKLDATVAMRLPLAQDEIDRRSTTLENAPYLAKALLAIGDLDAAQACAEEYGNEGYEVVDALLAAGEAARAKNLFEKLEPLQQLLTGRLDLHNILHDQEKFVQWARRVIHFRDLEQIKRAIDSLSNARFDLDVGHREKMVTQLVEELRQEVVLAMIAADPDIDIVRIINGMDLRIELQPTLLLHAGLSAHEQGLHEKSMELFKRAIDHKQFLKAPNGWRRSMALIAANSSEIHMAQRIFDSLAVPAIALLDNETDDNIPEYLLRAVMEHAQLSALLGRPETAVEPSKCAILRPLQLYACAVGTLQGEVQTCSSTITRGDVARLTARVLSYLAQVTPQGSDDFFAISQIIKAAPVLGKTLLQTADLCGKEEFSLVLAEFDHAFEGADEKHGIRASLRREIALEIYRINEDAKEASRRLEPSVVLLREDTPGAQVDGLAMLATAFSQTGNQTRARELLDQVLKESLGNDRPAKKDPLYDTWLKLLVRADIADPTRRGKRVSFLMRQVAGMMETEGRDSAYRLASPLIAEAVLHDARTGFEAARALSDKSTIGWPNMIDALLLGTVKRRPDLAMVCGITWCSLALPYYKEPYFRERHLGEFIDAAVNAVSASEIDNLVETLRAAIEAESRAHERSVLLQKLRLAAQKRSHTSTVLDTALQRWTAESPSARHSDTAMEYDEIKSLNDLKLAFEHDDNPDSPGYMASSAFYRLAPDADFQTASDMFDQWTILQKDSRARFLLVDLALDAGHKDYARRLVANYVAGSDERATWTEWTGGGMLRDFRARVKLDGPDVHPQAYRHFVDALATGGESIDSVLLEIDEILLVISHTPDWPAIWDLLAEQLATTREYAIGHPFDVNRTDMSDEEMMATLFRWAASMPLSEMQRHVRIGALMLSSSPGGKRIFQCLIGMLLDGTDDEPAEAMQLMLQDTQEIQDIVLREKVAALIDHPDYAVAEAASILSKHWGIATFMTRSELSPFYSFILEIQDNNFEAPTFVDASSGKIFTENPMDWTTFRSLIKRLARRHVTIAHIQHRSRMFIGQWGGLKYFGKMATDQLIANLDRTGMRIQFFWRPQVTVTARSLRHVAGELRRAGMITNDEISWLLHLMNYPAPTLPQIVPVPRPQFMPRPTAESAWSGSDAGEKWMHGVDGDTVLLTTSNEKVIAEISTFEIYEFRRARFKMERIRAPFLQVGNHVGITGWLGLLPKALWVNGFHAVSNELAPTFVRSLSISFWPEIPGYKFIICPNWLHRLGWRMHPNNWQIYLDCFGQIVARMVWWRDGGPVDVEEDVIWGEGVYLSVTTTGLAQIEKTIHRKLSVLTHACRKFEPTDGESFVRMASGEG
ncbi:MAG: ATP-binding protein, partial [Magnetococcales bacterium]|nr:ATP-binding protein [Magnetococcales bacterium]